MKVTEKKIRVLVVDDSAFMRNVMRGMIATDSTMEVIGEARDGREAVTLAESLRPDVISMDINMPHMDGLEATEVIMSRNPRPVVIVSSESRDSTRGTLRALELGAIDFVSKPSGAIDLDMNSVREELTRKLRMAAKVRVVRTAGRPPSQGARSVAPAPARSNGTAVAAPPPPEAAKTSAAHPVVVLAASTGGPAALMRLVPAVRKEIPAALMLALHMPANFTQQFTQQLAESSSILVKPAESGEMIRPGTLYVCPGSHHMRLLPDGKLQLDDGPRISGYRPCADVTLESVAAHAGPQAIGVVLTGMGNDAARGLLAVKNSGGYGIAQDEATSMIFGMPQEAIRAGAVDQVLPLDAINAAIEKRLLYLIGAAKVGAL